MIVLQDSYVWRALQKRTNAATICTYGSFHAFIKNWTRFSKAPSPLFSLSLFLYISSSFFHSLCRSISFQFRHAIFVPRSLLSSSPLSGSTLFSLSILFFCHFSRAHVDRPGYSSMSVIFVAGFSSLFVHRVPSHVRWKLFSPVFRAGILPSSTGEFG